jgi:hypothetical protein
MGLGRGFRRAAAPALLAPLVLALGACGPAPLARQDGRTVQLDGAGETLPLGPGRRQWRLPVRVEAGGGQRLRLVVELECDSNRPASGLVTLTRLRHQDDLLGLDRADPSLERSWGGEARPPAWLRTLARRTCGPGSLPPRWSGT